MAEKDANFIIVLDQGSRGAPPVVDNPETRSIVIDHHLSDDFPEGAEVSKCTSAGCLVLILSGRISMPLSASRYLSSPHL